MGDSGQMQFVEKTENFDNFSISLSERIYKFTRHHFISKSQEIFLQNLKSNFLINEVSILYNIVGFFLRTFLLLYKAKPKVWENWELGKFPRYCTPICSLP